jgi:hypothetical protein
MACGIVLDMVKTTLYLPEELQEQLHDIAAQTGRSQADLIREALARFVGEHRRPRPASIGIIDDPDLTGEGSEDWLRRAWEAR